MSMSVVVMVAKQCGSQTVRMIVVQGPLSPWVGTTTFDWKSVVRMSVVMVIGWSVPKGYRGCF